MSVVTFIDYTPIARFDGLPFETVEIFEQPEAGGQPGGTPVLIDTKPLSPVDTDTARPLPRSFTTEQATLDVGWYTVAFVDADGDRDVALPKRYPASPDRPTVDDVALLLRTRTAGGLQTTGLGADTGPSDLTTFTDQTRPSATEVEGVITQAADGLAADLIGALLPEQEGAMRHAVALYAAVLVETSFFKESYNDQLIRLWREMYQATIAGINSKLEEDPAVAGSHKRWGSVKIGSTLTETSTASADVDTF